MQEILRTFYEKLDAGQICAFRCKGCGKVMFPPRGICPQCGKYDCEWVDIPRKGKLLFSAVGKSLFYGRTYIACTVELDVGCLTGGELILTDFDFSRPESILEYNGKNQRVRLEIRKEDFGAHVVFLLE